MSKNKLRQLIDKRTPLRREAVTPVDMYTKPQVANTTQQVVKPTNPQIDKQTKPQVEKYTTHLKRETIKRIKILAAENDIADYEVVQSALDRYFERHK